MMNDTPLVGAVDGGPLVGATGEEAFARVRTPECISPDRNTKALRTQRPWPSNVGQASSTPSRHVVAAYNVGANDDVLNVVEECAVPVVQRSELRL